MNSKQIRKITEERLSEWADRLVMEHATPLLIVGVGHDYASGQVHIFVPSGLDNELAKKLMAIAFALLDDTGPEEPLSEVEPEPEDD